MLKFLNDAAGLIDLAILLLLVVWMILDRSSVFFRKKGPWSWS